MTRPGTLLTGHARDRCPIFPGGVANAALALLILANAALVLLSLATAALALLSLATAVALPVMAWPTTRFEISAIGSAKAPSPLSLSRIARSYHGREAGPGPTMVIPNLLEGPGGHLLLPGERADRRDPAHPVESSLTAPSGSRAQPTATCNGEAICVLMGHPSRRHSPGAVARHPPRLPPLLLSLPPDRG